MLRRQHGGRDAEEGSESANIPTAKRLASALDAGEHRGTKAGREFKVPKRKPECVSEPPKRRARRRVPGIAGSGAPCSSIHWLDRSPRDAAPDPRGVRVCGLAGCWSLGCLLRWPDHLAANTEGRRDTTARRRYGYV